MQTEVNSLNNQLVSTKRLNYDLSISYSGHSLVL